MRKFITSLLILGTLPIAAHAASGPQTVVQTTVTYTTSYVQSLNSYGGTNASASKLAAQVTFSSATFANKTFTSGTQSTGTISVISSNILAKPATNQITVPTTAQILGQAATGQFTITSNTGLGNGATAQITVTAVSVLTGSLMINGAVSINLLNGSNWITVDTASGTASNLATAINLYSGTTKIAAAWGGGTSAVVYATATINNTATNNYTLVPTSVQLTTTTFTNARNNAAIQVNGRTLTNGTDWTAQSTASGTAANLATAVNGTLGLVAAWGGGTSAVVYTTAAVTGTAGNSIAMATLAPLAISTSAATFSGGLGPKLSGDTILFNGYPGTNGIQWTDASGTSTGTAISINAWLNTFGVIVSTTNGTGSVIYTTATTAGSAGNAFTLTDTKSVLTIANPTFNNGQDAGYVTINGVRFTAGVDFSTSAVLGTIATNLRTAINASGTVGVSAGIQQTTIVVTTSTIVGSAANYVMTSSTDAALTLSGPKTVTNGASVGAMTGGTNSGVTLNSGVITLPAHGFVAALPVLFSTGSATAIGALANQTTYYVVVIDSNSIGLSSTTAVAQAGAYITITGTTTQTSAITYTLAPIPYSQGSAGGLWQVSNDGVNWANFTATSNNVTVVGNTFGAVNPSTTTVQDFGPVDYGYIRYSVTTPTWGGVVLKVLLNAKD